MHVGIVKVQRGKALWQPLGRLQKNGLLLLGQPRFRERAAAFGQHPAWELGDQVVGAWPHVWRSAHIHKIKEARKAVTLPEPAWVVSK